MGVKGNVDESQVCLQSVCVWAGNALLSSQRLPALHNDNGRRLVCASSDRKKGFSGRLQEVEFHFSPWMKYYPCLAQAGVN